MMKSFGVSSDSEQQMKAVMPAAVPAAPHSDLIDSAGHSMNTPTAPNGEKESKSTMGIFNQVLGPKISPEQAKGAVKGVMKFADDHPVITEAAVMAASVAFPPAAPALQAGKRAVDIANTADNLTGGNIKGLNEDEGIGDIRQQAQRVADTARPMLEGDASFLQVNQDWSQSKGMGLGDRASNTADAVTNRQSQGNRLGVSRKMGG